METFWKKFNSGIQSFYYDDNIIHVVPTSNPNGTNDDYYIILYDDAYFLDTGKTEILTKNQIEEKYKIEVS
jgi:hypothetical protein